MQPWQVEATQRAASSAALSRLLYPILRFGRNLTLAMLGRQKISRRETG